eukprot:364712-Chlamydomonas_euryale.AAC.8
MCRHQTAYGGPIPGKSAYPAKHAVCHAASHRGRKDGRLTADAFSGLVRIISRHSPRSTPVRHTQQSTPRRAGRPAAQCYIRLAGRATSRHRAGPPLWPKVPPAYARGWRCWALTNP